MNVINEIKTLLGMEVKLAQMKLKDGVTVIEADAFEPDNNVFIVNGEEKIPMPVGEYELEDGMILVVAVEGIVSGSHIALQGAAATPSITGATLIATFG